MSGTIPTVILGASGYVLKGEDRSTLVDKIRIAASGETTWTPEEPIAERGKNLSAGERQLIAFARMLVLAPDVLLLDEATSNVDSHTEDLLQEAVHRLMTGRTSLIVAHRLSTIRDVDRILVLHKGRLVETGSHEELLQRRGVYWRLYQLQYADQER